MPILAHAAAALTTLALALVAGAALPRIVPGTTGLTAVLAGLVVLLAGALIHEIVDRRMRDVAFRDRLMVDGQVLKLLQNQLVTLGGRVGENQPDLANVLAEVRILRTLVDHIAAGAGDPEPVPVMPSEPTVAQRVAGDEKAVLQLVRDALNGDRVDVFLQPIVSLPQRKVRYFDVFARIRAPDGSYLRAEDYLPVAEKAKLVAAIDDLLLFRSIRLVRETERRQHMVGFFVNLSSASLADQRFMGEFADYLAEHPGLAPKLVFEVPQADVNAGVLMADPARGLVRMGCKFSMDRVESLSIDPAQLARQQVRFVKLDASMLIGIARRPGGHANVMAFKHLIESHPIDVMCENVASEEQLVELLDLAMDFGQGTLFGEPYISRAAGG